MCPVHHTESLECVVIVTSLTHRSETTPPCQLSSLRKFQMCALYDILVVWLYVEITISKFWKVPTHPRWRKYCRSPSSSGQVTSLESIQNSCCLTNCCKVERNKTILAMINWRRIWSDASWNNIKCRWLAVNSLAYIVNSLIVFRIEVIDSGSVYKQTDIQTWVESRPRYLYTNRGKTWPRFPLSKVKQ